MEYGCNNRGRPRGFTLVELVIVVVIIAIIATIAAVRFGVGMRQTEEGALNANLTILRNAIDLYAAEHLSDRPGAKADGLGNAANSPAAFVNQLTKYSDDAGQVSLTPQATYPYGPYLRKIPSLPVSSKRGSSQVAIDAVNSPPLVTAGQVGWVYNPTTGGIIANSDEPNADGSRSFDEY